MERAQSGLEIHLSEFEFKFNLFLDSISACESSLEEANIYQVDIPGTSGDIKDLRRTWSDIRRGEDDMSRAKRLLEKEIAEDEWLVVLRL